MLEVVEVTRRFGAKAAVDAISFGVDRPAFVGIIGRSGAGKSTFLRMMNRLTDATAGEIRVDGRNILALEGAEKRQWQRQCAMIFQQFNLVPRMDVCSNVLHGILNGRSLAATLFNQLLYQLSVAAMADELPAGFFDSLLATRVLDSALPRLTADDLRCLPDPAATPPAPAIDSADTVSSRVARTSSSPPASVTPVAADWVVAVSRPPICAVVLPLLSARAITMPAATTPTA